MSTLNILKKLFMAKTYSEKGISGGVSTILKSNHAISATVSQAEGMEIIHSLSASMTCCDRWNNLAQ